MSEPDHGTGHGVFDRDAVRCPVAFDSEQIHALDGLSDLMAELSVGDFEAAHGGSAALLVGSGFDAVGGVEAGEIDLGFRELRIELMPDGVGNIALGVVWLDGVVGQSIDSVLLAQVLEEVLLAPAFEHAVGNLGGGEVAT